MPIPAAALAAGAGLAGLGALGNWLGNRENADRLSEAYDQIMAQANQATAANQADIDAFGNLVRSTYGQGAANYDKALQDFLNSEVYQNEGFSFDGDINQYFDPAANQRVAAAMEAIDNAAATGGNRFSSDYVNRVAAKQQALASEEWQNAYNRLMQAENQKLAEWNANSQNAWNNYNATQQRAQYAVDAYGNDRNQYMQGLSDATMAGMNNRNANLQTQAQTLMGQANAQNDTGVAALLGNLGSAGASFMGNFFGGK